MSIKVKATLLVLWFPFTLLSLFGSVIWLKTYTRTKQAGTLVKMQAKELALRNGYQFYAALPEVLGSFSTSIVKEDARPEILRNFLSKNDSPLAAFADKIVAVSDEYSVDFRLITAIGMCESNLGKKMPEGSYNAWGYAIYTGQSSGAEFENWEHAIEVMAEYLATKYYSQGLTTPEEIGPIYAPPSVQTGNSWAKCVRSFLDELE